MPPRTKPAQPASDNPLNRMVMCPDCGYSFKTGNQSKHGGCPKCNSQAWSELPQPVDAIDVALDLLESCVVREGFYSAAKHLPKIAAARAQHAAMVEAADRMADDYEAWHRDSPPGTLSTPATVVAYRAARKVQP